jgi:hypothetical protein
MSPLEVAAGIPASNVEGVQRQDLGLEGRRDVPAHDPVREDVRDERDVGGSRPRRGIRDLDHPETARSVGPEVALHEIPCQRRRRVGLRGEDPLRLLHPANAGEPREPVGLIPPDVPARTPHQRMHLATAVGAVVLGVQASDAGNEQLVAQRTSGRRPGLHCAIPARREESLDHQAQDSAERQDPDAILVLVDEADDLGQGRTSSFARDTLAALRVSLALRNPPTSRLIHLICSAAPLAFATLPPGVGLQLALP